MRKELLNENRHRILLAVVTLVVLAAALLTGQLVYQRCMAQNDQAVDDALRVLTYSEEQAVEEEAILKVMTQLAPLSESSRGPLYRALAEISYMLGDDMVYNTYVAQALYHLMQEGDAVGAVYLGNKYIGRLYANGCYDTAEEVLRRLADMTPIAELPLDMQAAYYLSCADVAQMQQKDDAEARAKAQSAIQLLPEGSDKQLNQAKLTLLTARALTDQDDFDGAAALLAHYSDTDDFGFGAHQVYVVCDFLLPYCELSARLCLHREENNEADGWINRYIGICDSYHFRAMKLHLLRYAAAHTAEDAEQASRYTALAHATAEQNLEEISGEYGRFLLADIDSTMREAAERDREADDQLRAIPWAAALLYLLVLGCCLGGMLLDYMNKDGLTRLNSRKQYERARIICEKKRIPYGLLMLDIDNFKRINDTYGHEAGDQVLRGIANVLHSYGGRGITSYRYGGEELCMMLLRVPERRVREIAEELRVRVEQTVGQPDRPVTISGGIAMSAAGENVFREADRRLYEAKGNGKNRMM